ncbi:MAG: proline--tRNA ligase [Minisyncoccia bacterium]
MQHSTNKNWEWKQSYQKITPRSKNFSQWYQDVVKAADLAEYGPIRGSMILKPYGYAIWEKIRAILDQKFKELGVENVYFPSLIPERFLKKEKEHLEGFSPEVAVVTYAGGERLKEALIIRPTSETIMYPTMAKWIHSYRDLPILINQWVNVIRWEMRPRLFLRTTEFLWQEGHTAHVSSSEAEGFAQKILALYQKFGEEYLAIPLIPGFKSEAEKFAGAVRTYTLEAMMQDGKALQFATSHYLGQNFAEVFNLHFVDKNSKKEYCWQTSWGLSTRVIGALIMVHGDDKGLVLPPKIAPIQIVIIPIWYNNHQREIVLQNAQSLVTDLKKIVNGEIKVDLRDLHPGEKYYYWEKRGVPLRFEIGPKDLESQSVVVVRRDTGEKMRINIGEINQKVPQILNLIQEDLYKRAQNFRQEKTKKVSDWKNFQKEIHNHNFVFAHWDGTVETEEKIKNITKASIRCIPLDILDINEVDGLCIYSKKPTRKIALFAKGY